MSSDNTPNNNSNNAASSNIDMPPRNRRGSITQAALTNLFQRGGSLPNGSGFPGQPTNGASNPVDTNRRRLSVTTIGLSGTSPTNGTSFNIRRGSLSTNSNSDSIDESAIEDDEPPYSSARTAPTTPFVRRMSFGAPAMRNMRRSGSPGNGNSPSSPPPSSHLRHTYSGKRTSQPQTPVPATSISAALSAAGRRSSIAVSASSLPQASNTKHTRAPSDNYTPRADQQAFNWSEQLRSRAESSVTGARPSFSFASTSPPRGSIQHDRAKSISDMPQPPVQAAAVKPKQERPKPDAFQERILKGDFYMD